MKKTPIKVKILDAYIEEKTEEDYGKLVPDPLFKSMYHIEVEIEGKKAFFRIAKERCSNKVADN